MSRRDGIRAGSVSGPWRSGPREDTAAPPEPGADRPHVVLEAEPARVHAAPRRGPSLMIWTAVGAVAALAIVAAAFLLRPGAPATQPPEPVAVSPEAAAPAVETDTAATASGTTGTALASVSNVRLRIGPDFPADREQSVLQALAGAGLDSVRVEALPFEIATSRVGYYRDADLAAAEALGELIGPVLGGGPVGVRDYSQLLSDPEPGRLDLWIGG